MQNSGLGQALNAVASLVEPYHVPMLLVVSLRGTEGDQTAENRGMGRLTSVALEALRVPVVRYRGSQDEQTVAAFLERPNGSGGHRHGPRALLVHPHAFGWQA